MTEKIEKDWLTTQEAVKASNGEYKYAQLKTLFAREKIPTQKRHGEKRRRVRPWILDAHRKGFNVSRVPADITKEELVKLLPSLKRG